MLKKYSFTIETRSLYWTPVDELHVWHFPGTDSVNMRFQYGTKDQPYNDRQFFQIVCTEKLSEYAYAGVKTVADLVNYLFHVKA